MNARHEQQLVIQHDGKKGYRRDDGGLIRLHEVVRLIEGGSIKSLKVYGADGQERTDAALITMLKYLGLEEGIAGWLISQGADLRIRYTDQGSYLYGIDEFRADQEGDQWWTRAVVPVTYKHEHYQLVEGGRTSLDDMADMIRDQRVRIRVHDETTGGDITLRVLWSVLGRMRQIEKQVAWWLIRHHTRLGFEVVDADDEVAAA